MSKQTHPPRMDQVVFIKGVGARPATQIEEGLLVRTSPEDLPAGTEFTLGQGRVVVKDVQPHPQWHMALVTIEDVKPKRSRKKAS